MRFFKVGTVRFHGFDPRLFAMGPEPEQAVREIRKFGEGGRLAKVGVSPEAESVFDIAPVGGGAPNDRGNDAEIGIVGQPLQDFKAAGAGAF